MKSLFILRISIAFSRRPRPFGISAFVVAGGDTLVLNHVGREVRIARKARAQLWFVVGSIAGCMLLAGSLSGDEYHAAFRTHTAVGRSGIPDGRRCAPAPISFANSFCEAIVMSAVGAVIGALFALAGVSILERLDVVIEASLAFFVLPTVCALVAGALFGIVPARRRSETAPCRRPGIRLAVVLSSALNGLPSRS